MIAVKVKDLKQGEWFTVNPVEYPKDSQVYIRGDYYRPDKKYYCSKWADIGSCRGFKGDKVVYTDFIF